MPSNNYSGRWSILGQSFGGFCVVTYLSIAPEGRYATLCPVMFFSFWAILFVLQYGNAKTAQRTPAYQTSFSLILTLHFAACLINAFLISIYIFLSIYYTGSVTTVIVAAACQALVA